MERTPIAYVKDYLLSLLEKDNKTKYPRYYQFTNLEGDIVHDNLSDEEAFKLFQEYFKSK